MCLCAKSWPRLLTESDPISGRSTAILRIALHEMQTITCYVIFDVPIYILSLVWERD